MYVYVMFYVMFFYTPKMYDEFQYLRLTRIRFILNDHELTIFPLVLIILILITNGK